MLFDCATRHAIKRNQMQSVLALAPPTAESGNAREPAQTAASAQIAKIQHAIKEEPSVPSADPE